MAAKKKYTFKIGDRVGSFYDENENVFSSTRKDFSDYGSCGDQFGEITAIDQKNNFLFITWDEEYMNNENKPLDPTFVLPEVDLKQLSSKLEKEFKQFEKGIKTRVQVIAKELRAINQDVKKKGYKPQEMYNAVQPLVSAMNASGWNSSSWNC